MLGVALSQPSFCLLLLEVSCHVRGVTLLRLPDDVPHGEKERLRSRRMHQTLHKEAMLAVASPSFPNSQLNPQIPNPSNCKRKKWLW